MGEDVAGVVGLDYLARSSGKSSAGEVGELDGAAIGRLVVRLLQGFGRIVLEVGAAGWFCAGNRGFSLVILARSSARSRRTASWSFCTRRSMRLRSSGDRAVLVAWFRMSAWYCRILSRRSRICLAKVRVSGGGPGFRRVAASSSVFGAAFFMPALSSWKARLLSAVVGLAVRLGFRRSHVGSQCTA